MLSENELQRYQRHFQINGWNPEIQLKLKESSVFVAGSGGLGSPVLYYLAAAGIGCIKFCDRDIVDLGNLNRQILFGSDDIGKDKVNAAYSRLSGLNSDIRLEPLKNEINTKIIPDIKGCDLIVDCVDNFETRHFLNRVSFDLNIPMVHAGVTEFFCQLTFLKPGETPCLSCFIPEGTQQSGKGITGAMAGIAGSIQALEAIKYLTGLGDILTNRLLFIDMKNLSFNTMTLKKNPECKVCSGFRR